MTKMQLRKEIREQEEWIRSQGGNLLGYLKRYGDPGKDAVYHGAGGRLIYAADTAALRKLEEQLRSIKE